MAKRRKRPAWVTRAATRDRSAVTRYAVGVVTGSIVAGPWVRLAGERHLRDLLEGKQRGLVFDRHRSEHLLTFVPDFLRLAEGQFDGQPFRLEPWQAFILGSVFGWVTTGGAHPREPHCTPCQPAGGSPRYELKASL